MTVSIRRMELSDAKDLAGILSNKNVLDNLRDGVLFPYTEDDGIAYVDSVNKADPNNVFAFAVLNDGKFVGHTSVFRGKEGNEFSAELGYYLSEKEWGKGIMTEAVKKTCEFVFNNSDIKNIYAFVFESNIASCRVLEKTGFIYERTLEKSIIKGGIAINAKVYCLSK